MKPTLGSSKRMAGHLCAQNIQNFPQNFHLYFSTYFYTENRYRYNRYIRFLSGIHSAAMAEDAESLKLEMLDEDSLTRQPDEVSCQ